MSSPSYEIVVKGRVSWDLLSDYDNSTNNGTIREKITVNTTKAIDYHTYQRSFNLTARREVENSHERAHAGCSYLGISAIFDSNIDISREVTETLEKTTEETFNANFSQSTTYEREIVVGPHSKLALYQQRFAAPGISVLGSAVSTNPPKPKRVSIRYIVQPIRFIKWVHVAYGGAPSEAPGHRVRDLGNGNDDINAGYGGKFVWLVPEYTYNAAEAATTVDLFIQENGHGGWPDLAAGAGGSFRFLRPVADESNPAKITSLKLFRLGQGLGGVPAPYTGCTGDINANRGGSFLYLLWTTHVAY